MLCMTALAFLTACEPHKRQIDESSLITDSCEQFMEKYDMDYVPTVSDVLQQREQLKYAIFIDSVYLNMPTEIVAHMLATKGTCISETEIVEDYLKNKDFYHDTILTAIKVNKDFLKDTIPRYQTSDIKINPEEK